MNRSHAHNLLDRVREEFIVAQYSVKTVESNWADHRRAVALMNIQLNVGDVRRCLANIEVTYILNLFATFEAILRDYWDNGLQRSTQPEVRVLIDRIGARRTVNPATLSATHAIRVFRNEIVHRNTRILRFDFKQCAQDLSRFLSWLPNRW